MNVARYRKAIAAVLTASVALALDLGVELPADVGALVDPIALAISAALVFLVPNAPAVSGAAAMAKLDR